MTWRAPANPCFRPRSSPPRPGERRTNHGASMEPTRRSRLHASRRGQLFMPLKLGLPRKGTQSERGAWEQAPHENPYEDREGSASAAERTTARRSGVKNLDLTRFSPNGLDSVAGEMNGATHQERQLQKHQPTSIVLTSFHRGNDIWLNLKPRRQSAS